ncbi:MAG TPA: sialidase family protein [Tahibacter sp.]|uniref:sialidase family protein n=1 Tax=Tahibacter sp. TaxID=2056211 RepID=UPI002C4DBDA2|nr:sialidase family protein [Tahibacter sp.]HSX62686.1 sialidase family protein [Tahibacter sp.]
MRNSLLRLALGPALLLACAGAGAQQTVSGGSGVDYQPSVLRAANGDIVAAFERLNASAFGDLWITRSADGGANWSTPAPIVATSANERHPALLQLPNGSFLLFYLKGTGATSTYRLYRATSPDGATFTEQGQLALGWATGGEVNPHVIRHPDGTLTMTYQRLGSGSYVAQSADDGATWDQLKTVLASGSQLPRIAFRASDARYLATYQVGSSSLDVFAKTTTDVRDWSAAPATLESDGDNHDSLPVVMPDDRFAVFYIHADGSQYDIYSRRSADGVAFEPALPQEISAGASDVEPHPLVGDSASTVDLYWGREAPAGSGDYDIVHRSNAVVADAIFAGRFE